MRHRKKMPKFNNYQLSVEIKCRMKDNRILAVDVATRLVGVSGYKNRARYTSLWTTNVCTSIKNYDSCFHMHLLFMQLSSLL